MHFIGAYIFILCLSAAFAAWAFATVADRLVRLLGLAPASVPGGGVFALLAAIGFLTVVGAPPAILVAALVLLLTTTLTDRDIATIPLCAIAPIAAVALGLSGITLPPIATVPPMTVLMAAAGGWYTITLSGLVAPRAIPAATIGLTATLLPLGYAALTSPAVPDWIALDAGLLLSAYLGAYAARIPTAILGAARVPLAFCIGWLILQTAAHGALIWALASLLAWMAALAYAMLHERTARNDDAFSF